MTFMGFFTVAFLDIILSSLVFTEIRFCIVHGRALVAFRHERWLALWLFNKASKDFFKAGFTQHLLHGSDAEDILSKVDALVAWASDIKDYALQQAISGKVWSGWKLVEGRSNRRYVNDAAVAAAVTKAGFDPYEQKLLGVTAMQKLLGKARFEEVLAGLIEKPQGKPTLVPESDKRPAMNNAKSDFSEN